VYEFCSVDNKAKGTITLNDFYRLLPGNRQSLPPSQATEAPADYTSADIPTWKRVVEPFYRFTLAGLAGGENLTFSFNHLLD